MWEEEAQDANATVLQEKLTSLEDGMSLPDVRSHE